MTIINFIFYYLLVQQLLIVLQNTFITFRNVIHESITTITTMNNIAGFAKLKRAVYRIH